MSERVGERPRLLRRWRLWVYLALLCASALVQSSRIAKPTAPPGARQFRVETSAALRADAAPTSLRMGGLEWRPPTYAPASGTASARGPGADIPAVVLLHGSPGRADDFARLAGELAQEGFRVVALDLLGFKRTQAIVSDYSIDANARAVLAVLPALGISRAHVVGWSNGGGVAMHIAARAPERVASLTLLASIGTQEHEGSGSFFFEHVKYGVGYLIGVVGAELVPHFGLLGPRQMRHAAMRFFWDSDMRPLRALMQDLRTPTLVLHGRHDFLVPARGAEAMHSLIPSSRLVMLDASHFIPLMQTREATSFLAPFFRRHSEPGVPPETGTIDQAPVPEPTGLRRVLEPVRELVRAAPWQAQVALVALGTLLGPAWAAVIAAMWVSGLDVDLAVGIVGLATGLWLTGLLRFARARAAPGVPPELVGVVSVASWRERVQRAPGVEGWRSQFDPLLRRAAPESIGHLPPSTGALAVFFTARALAALSAACATLPLLLIARFILDAPLGRLVGPWAWAPLIVLLRVGAFFGLHVVSRRGRQVILASLRRARHHEFWPSWLFYLPFMPYFAFLIVRYGGIGSVTCANPGVEAGGGVVGESKSRLMEAIASSNRALATVLVPAHRAGNPLSPEDRAALVRAQQLARPEVFAFPVVLKPDAAQRGFAFRIVRTDADLRAYFKMMTRDAVLQQYHPGPHEIGVVWARRADILRARGEPRPGRGAERFSAAPAHTPAQAPAASAGYLFSVTDKQFARLTGDGDHSLEELIYAHPRLRAQASVFLERHARRVAWVPGAGEVVALGAAGNHCQGTLFRDGAEFITPSLEAALDHVARSFRGQVDRARDPADQPGGELDFARFDLRFADPEELKAGRGFAIVELNGTFGESTNIYDPRRTAFWAYRVLFRQWRTLYELGALRRAQGVRAMRVPEFVRMIRNFYRDRPGSALAD